MGFNSEGKIKMTTVIASKARRLILAGDAPADMQVNGDLDLSDLPIAGLPDGISVGGDLNVSGTAITTLTSGLSVGGSLHLERGLCILS